MALNEDQRAILDGLERRKLAKDDPCDSCNGRGGDDERICLDCLGQGVLLTRQEYTLLLDIAGIDDAAILSQQEFDYPDEKT